ncbi:MAG: YggU family protein [Candidatus Accumulibacter sp.]|nr:YggU family protein [Accumulibacter sp.]
MVDWLRTTANGIILTIHAQPGAKRSEVAGLHGDALKIRLAAPAVDGLANAALIHFLAEKLALPRAAITVTKGRSSRHKVLQVHDAPADSRQRLLAIAARSENSDG